MSLYYTRIARNATCQTHMKSESSGGSELAKKSRDKKNLTVVTQGLINDISQTHFT